MVEPFHKLFPEEAQREYRMVEVCTDGENGDAPPGEYCFIESYCTNPDCDCERVIIDVAERRLGIVAAVSYYFNPASDPTHGKGPNPCLEPSSRQSEYAEKALALFKKLVLEKEYNDRLIRHYQLVKSAARFAASSVGGRHESATGGRGKWAKQQRKNQKAARRKTRRR